MNRGAVIKYPNVFNFFQGENHAPLYESSQKRNGKELKEF